MVNVRVLGEILSLNGREIEVHQPNIFYQGLELRLFTNTGSLGVERIGAFTIKKINYRKRTLTISRVPSGASVGDLLVLP